MQIRTSKTSDLSDIMNIIGDAQRYLASLNIDQWQDGYPNEERIVMDMQLGESYVVVNDENEIMATTVYSMRPEVTYNSIKGNWQTAVHAKYGVIHRIAVSDKFRSLGLAHHLFENFEQTLRQQNFESLRVDTHNQNKGMQNLLQKRGYIYCGIIILESGAERLAFEKIL